MGQCLGAAPSCPASAWHKDQRDRRGTWAIGSAREYRRENGINHIVALNPVCQEWPPRQTATELRKRRYERSLAEITLTGDQMLTVLEAVANTALSLLRISHGVAR